MVRNTKLKKYSGGRLRKSQLKFCYCRFITSKKIRDTQIKNSENKKPLNTVIVTSNSFNIHCNEAKSLKNIDSLKFGSYSNGPVIKLPVETKIIMRMDQSSRDTKIKCVKCQMRQESQESKCSSKTKESKDTTQRIAVSSYEVL